MGNGIFDGYTLQIQPPKVVWQQGFVQKPPAKKSNLAWLDERIEEIRAASGLRAA